MPAEPICSCRGCTSQSHRYHTQTGALERLLETLDCTSILRGPTSRFVYNAQTRKTELICTPDG
jgi:hypothetical protein